MGFLKDIFNNFFSMIFGCLGIIAFFLAIISFFTTGLFTHYSPWLGVGVFAVIGFILIAIGRAFSKRG